MRSFELRHPNGDIEHFREVQTLDDGCVKEQVCVTYYCAGGCEVSPPTKCYDISYDQAYTFYSKLIE